MAFPDFPVGLGEQADPGTKLDPSSISSDYAALQEYWHLVDTILGGKEAMQKQGEKYLPRFQEEQRNSKDSQQRTYDPYLRRLQMAPFTNVFDDILKNLSSKPFSRELKLKDGTPKPYTDLAEDIDAQGQSFHVFGHDVFRDTLAHAISWIMVDYTRAMPRADGRALSRAEESAQGLRPYWVWISAPRMLAAYSDVVDGQETITHARYREDVVKLDAFLEVLVERVRVMWREPIEFDLAGKPTAYGGAFYALWERIQPPGGQTSGVWQIIEVGQYTIGYLPLVPVFLGERKFATYQTEPPLRNLAWMQLEEYNLESNIQGIGESTCFPMYAAIGMNRPKDETLVVGPRSVVYVPPPGEGRMGDFKAVEPSGSSVKVMVDRLKEVRTEMRDLGMQPLTQSNLTVITTGQVAVKANSQVEAWAIRFRDALEQCWMITADWLGQPNFQPEVIIHLDYSAAMDQGVGFNSVQQMRLNKDVSRETVVSAAQRYGYLPDDYDAQHDAELLAEEQQGLQPETQIDPRTGKPIVASGAPPQPPPQPPPGAPPIGNGRQRTPARA